MRRPADRPLRQQHRLVGSEWPDSMSASACTVTGLDAMLTRSFPRVARATRHPSLTGPTTSSSGTNTSSRNTSLKSFSPVISVNGLTRTPAAFMSITIVVMPACLAESGSVRTVASPSSLSCARLDQTFWPETSHPPSVRRPLVVMEAASDPAPGSLKSWHQRSDSLEARPNPAVHLFGCRVLEHGQQHPLPDSQGRAFYVGELVLHHELLHCASGASVRLRPVRHQIAGMGERHLIFLRAMFS